MAISSINRGNMNNFRTYILLFNQKKQMEQINKYLFPLVIISPKPKLINAVLIESWTRAMLWSATLDNDN